MTFTTSNNYRKMTTTFINYTSNPELINNQFGLLGKLFSVWLLLHVALELNNRKFVTTNLWAHYP